MAIRVDPRRLGHLKQLAAEAGLRPGDLVRQWVEERIDAERGGVPGAPTLAAQLEALSARVAALEGTTTTTEAPATPDARPASATSPKAPESSADDPDGDATSEPAPEPSPAEPAPGEPVTPKRRAARKASAAPATKVALHDEMIEVIRERGPMTASDLASAIAERGRYTPPRSGKPLDAAMVSQRVSNPTYRSRFTRDEGRIGLVEVEGT